MKILLIGSYKYSIYAAAFKNAWEKMGHEVEAIDYEKFQYKGKRRLASVLNRIQARFLIGLPMLSYNSYIRNKVNEFKPDLVFLYRCNNIFGSTIKSIKEKSTIFSYHNDDPFGGVPSDAFYRLYRRTTKHCHLNYVYRKKNIYDLKKIGVENSKVLLPYYMRERNFPIDCEKDIQVAFLGHYEPDGRDSVISCLLDAGVEVRVFGSEWQHAPLYDKIKRVHMPALSSQDYNKMINRTKILLVFFSKRNNDTYTRRSFELPATRSFMLCEYTDDMDSMFPDKEAAVYFRTQKDAVEKCLYYLRNDEKRIKIASKAYDIIMKMGGSEFDRANEVIRDFESMKRK